MRIENIELRHTKMELISPFTTSMGTEYDEEHIHQAVLPLFMGTLKKVPQYNFLISSDIVTLPGKEILPSCEEIKKMRGGN